MGEKIKYVISTKKEEYYAVLFEDGKIHSIAFNTPGKSKTYYFNPEEKWQPKITDEFLKEALSEMIASKISTFEKVYTSLKVQKYKNIAQEVFKEYFNRLYNTVVADDVLGRNLSFNSICVAHDFFKESKK